MKLRREKKERAEGLADWAREAELREKAKERLDALDQLGESSERHSIRAGWHKRQAVALSTPEQAQERAQTLTASAKEYFRAWELSGPDPERRKPYGGLNALQLVALGATLDPEERGQLETCLKPEPVVERTESFWDRVAVADRELTSRLLSCTLAGEADHVVAAYEKVFEERSTPSERKAVRDHITELAELAAEAQKTALETVYQRLEELESSPS
jgi:hypothetical protein